MPAMLAGQCDRVHQHVTEFDMWAQGCSKSSRLANLLCNDTLEGV